MANPTNLEQILEGLLFAYGEPISLKKLEGVVKKKAADINLALNNIKTALSQRGIRLISKNNEWQLVADTVASAYIEKLIKSEMQQELTPAGLEVLALAAYRGPITKHGIESIRGVNSTYVLRNLMARGLVEKNELSKPASYEISLAALRKLGLEQREDLPRYIEHKQEISNVEKIISPVI
ncbi:MAG: SMC-Scp complex subunit ScpB [Parcubacteria group bacterium]|nr:SMC-Scp complex subunit ScpB [Parcubacteria group bacterium]